jgi:two-component system sensor histidine kinase YesM
MIVKDMLFNKLYAGHIKNKLLFAYFFLIIIPLGSFSLFTMSVLSNMLQEQTLSAATKTFENTTYITEETFSQIENLLNTLAKNELIYRMASTDTEGYSLYNQLMDTNSIEDIFGHFREITKADRLRFYVNNDGIYTGQNREIFHINEIEQADWYLDATNSIETNFLFDPALYEDVTKQEKEMFSLVRIIYNPSNITEILALLRVDIDKKEFINMAVRTPVTKNSSFFLMQENEMLLTSKKKYEEQFYSELFTELSTNPSKEWLQVQICKENYFYRYSTIYHTNWNVVSVVPYADVYGDSIQLCIELLILVLVVGGISYFIAYVVARSTFDRIIRLTESIKKVEEGDVGTVLSVQGTDEIGLTMQAFNNMMRRINILMNEREEDGKEIKSLELKALQAQINPHFLYNSLDLINCIAIEREVPDIVTMVNALGKFYKISLSQGRDIISIQEEIMHAELYVKIQNLRFNYNIHFVVQAEKETLECKIIKIVLQPIVENAIIHGIFEKPTQEGIILLTVALNQDDILFTIQDNGIGMDETTWKEHFDFQKDKVSTSKGYGVRNIHERCQLAYGTPYGITCISKENEGTTVTLRIPRQE